MGVGRSRTAAHPGTGIEGPQRGCRGIRLHRRLHYRWRSSAFRWASRIVSSRCPLRAARKLLH